MAAEWESDVFDCFEVKMQADTGADITIILLSTRLKLGKLTRDGIARTVEAYDGQKLYFKGTAICDFR